MATTARFRADSTSYVFTSWNNPPPHTGTPSDGSSIQVVQDDATPSTRSEILTYTGGTGNTPTWKSPGAMALPSALFDGTNDYLIGYQYSGIGTRAISQYFASNGKTLIIAARLTASATNNATIYQNTALMSDGGAYMGIHFKTISGTTYAYGYNYDGSADVTTGIAVNLDQDYIFELRHGTGPNRITLTVVTGAGGSSSTSQFTTSGSTSAMTGTFTIGKSYQTHYHTGYVGEIRCDNTDLGASSSERSAMITSWLPSGGYTLTSDVGAFTLTGIAANLLRGTLVTASAGAFTLTGVAAGLNRGLLVSASPGSFTLTGVAAGLLKTWLASADPGSLSLTGQDANLLRSWIASVEAGLFALTGQDAGLLKASVVQGEAGSFAFTGQQADLLRGLKLACDAASFIFTGIATDLIVTVGGVFCMHGILGIWPRIAGALAVGPTLGGNLSCGLGLKGNLSVGPTVRGTLKSNSKLTGKLSLC